MSMTTINKVIERVDAVKPNAYGEEEKTAWISTLDGMVQRLVMQKDEAVAYRYPDDMDKELLIPFPFEDAYLFYLMAQIDFHNREYDNYNNSTMMFNSAFEDFKKAYIRENMPKQSGNYRNVF